MYHYLRQGEIAYIQGEALYMHGGITQAKNLYKIPGNIEVTATTIQEWVTELNQWKNAQMDIL